MSYYWSGDDPETSHQITLNMIHQDLLDYMDKTDEKLEMLQEQISQILREMSGVLRTQEQEIEVFYDDSEPELNEEEERQYNEMLLQVQQPFLAHREKTNAKLKVKEELTAAYEGAPIFDEDPRDNKADWHCYELLCKALGLEDSFKAKQNSDSNSTDAKVLDCTSVFKPDDKKNLEVTTKLKSQMSKDLTTVVLREELRLHEPIPCSHSYSLDKASCKFSRGQVHIFDPGGYMQHDHSTCVLKMFKARTRNKLLQELNELRKEVYVVQIVQSAELHDQDIQTYNGETYRVIIKMNQQTVDSMYQTGFDTKNVMKIFDPGGKMHKGWGLYYPEFEDLQTNCQQACLFIVSKEGPTTRLDNNQSVLVPKECSKGMTDGSVQVLSATTDMYSDSKGARMLARPSRCIDLRQGSPGKVMRFEIHDAWRRKYTITIFDPGGKKWSHEINHEDMVVFQRREICQDKGVGLVVVRVF